MAKLSVELDALSENKWRQICIKSLHHIKNEVTLYQMKDEKLSKANNSLKLEIEDLKNEVGKLSLQRTQLSAKKK
eukprot:CAMPEP_0197055412 /NCGR_PEP_ID=MMETSP1384-20130603/64798_1 /TAXON_ID=29189 /ORGANISM="Ammonia sp." /LENGTH=74 /DNA_ID=CAMNT_0042488981 /DNA_START=150 /DNA_END=374 /DNA_ORIENTATION=-